MPRIRTIKPQFWSDDKIICLSRDARLFFIALWNFADDQGVLEFKPIQLKANIFPLDDDIGVEEIKEFVAELENTGLLVVYEYEKKHFLWIKNFSKHQKIDRKRKSTLPLPDFVKKKNKCLETLGNQCVHDFSRNQLKSTEISLGKGRGKGKGKGRGRGREEEEYNINNNSIANAMLAEKCDFSACCSGEIKTPYKEIVWLYHNILLDLPKMRVLNETRKRHISARVKDVLKNKEIFEMFAIDNEKSDKEKIIEWFKGFFNYVAKSDFLCGKVMSKNRDRPFIADLEWLMRPNNFAKVLEGKYHDKQDNVKLSAIGKKNMQAFESVMKKIKDGEF